MSNNQKSRSSSVKTKLFIALIIIGIIIPNFIFAQFSEQGPKLVGTGSVGNHVSEGNSLAISSDGSTAIVGGQYDNNSFGAFWIFTRTGNSWTQQGPKLIGSGAVGSVVYQGYSVAISSDGNTAAVGGIGDNTFIGAVWVFTRSGGVWTQEGSKLVGTGFVGPSVNQGTGVALSSDGNTLVVGATADASTIGAIWVFTRSSGVWTQQGSKLVGSGPTGQAGQGISVAVSSDGNTFIEGGYGDNFGSPGASWVFTRSGGVWTQQGSKLVGTGAGGAANQGWSVAISSDGNTAAVGGYLDNNDAGAVWIFTRSGGVWIQQGPKLSGSGSVGTFVLQGFSVAISGDGNTVIEGGTNDNSSTGAVWMFTRNGGVWTQLGSKLVGLGGVGNIVQQGSAVAISSDGNTVIEGGVGDNSLIGAAWVFVRSNYRFVSSHTNLNKPILGNQNTFDSISVFTEDVSSYYVSNVKVSIDTIIYPDDGDLEISLLHLTNSDTLVYQVGGSGANFTGTSLSDSASILISNGTAPFTGNFKPSKSLSQFINFDPSGAWTLKVYDRTTGHSGTLNAWTLTIDLTPNPVSVNNISLEVPGGFSLKQNYPNPFNPATKFGMLIAKYGFVKVSVYDIIGREVAVLVNQQLKPGSYEINWDASNFPSGAYFYTMRAENYSQTKKMVLLK